MYVKLLTGRYAGQIRDVAPDAAQQLLKEGRAKDPRDAHVTQPVARHPAKKASK